MLDFRNNPSFRFILSNIKASRCSSVYDVHDNISSKLRPQPTQISFSFSVQSLIHCDFIYTISPLSLRYVLCSSIFIMQKKGLLSRPFQSYIKQFMLTLPTQMNLAQVQFQQIFHYLTQQEHQLTYRLVLSTIDPNVTTSFLALQ
jgi:hypothetical protein